MVDAGFGDETAKARIPRIRPGPDEHPGAERHRPGSSSGFRSHLSDRALPLARDHAGGLDRLPPSREPQRLVQQRFHPSAQPVHRSQHLLRHGPAAGAGRRHPALEVHAPHADTGRRHPDRRLVRGRLQRIRPGTRAPEQGRPGLHPRLHASARRDLFERLPPRRPVRDQNPRHLGWPPADQRHARGSRRLCQ